MQAKNNISWETQHIFPIDILFFPFITMKLIIPIPTQGFYFSNVEHQILHYVCNRINIYPINGDPDIPICYKTLTRFELHKKAVIFMVYYKYLKLYHLLTIRFCQYFRLEWQFHFVSIPTKTILNVNLYDFFFHVWISIAL